MKTLLKIVVPTVLFSMSIFTFANDIPKNKGFINDYANVIDETSKKDIEKTLAAYKAKTKNQISILTVANHDGISMEEYATKVFEEWKLGKKDVDNGVLILLSIKEREVRIEVGYGLEGYLTDLSSHRINQSMTPYFNKGQWGEGLKIGIPQIMETSTENKDINTQVELAAKEIVSIGKAKQDDLLQWAAIAYFIGGESYIIAGAIGAYGLNEVLPTNDKERQIATCIIGALIMMFIVWLSKVTGIDFSIFFLWGLLSRGSKSDDDSEGEGGGSGGGGSTDNF